MPSSFNVRHTRKTFNPVARRRKFRGRGSKTTTQRKRKLKLKRKSLYLNVKRRRRFKRQKMLTSAVNGNPWKKFVTGLSYSRETGIGQTGTFDIAVCSLYKEVDPLANPTPKGVFACPFINTANSNKSDIAYALQAAGENNLAASPSRIYIKGIQDKSEIRNNGNIACNIRYYVLKPAFDQSITDFTTGSELWNYALGVHFTSTAAADVNNSVKAYDLPAFKQYSKIIKCRQVRLLPGEKINLGLSRKFLSANNNILGRETSQGWSRFMFATFWGDPVHDNTNTGLVSTSPVKLDVIRTIRFSTKSVEKVNEIPITSGKVYGVVNIPVFTSAYANESTVFETQAPA